MGFYGCMFVLTPEQNIPELFEYHNSKVVFERGRQRELMKVIYQKLGARFRPYYSMAPIPRETIFTADEVAEKYAAFQNSHYDSTFDLNEFVVEELSLDLAEDGSAYRDFILQEENEETFEGRFDSFNVDSGAMIFIDKNGSECSIIKVNDLDLDKTISKLQNHSFTFEFILDTNGKMIYPTDAEDDAERIQVFKDYISALDPEYTLVMTELHD